MKLPIEEKHLFSKKHFLDELAVSLGGYAAEKMIFDDITTGASNDIFVATDIARSLVTKYGMSDKIGPVALEGKEGAIFFGKDFYSERNYSEDVAKEIDSEVKKFMTDAQKKATELLKKNKKALETIASELIEKETIERKEFDDILISSGIKLKKERDQI